MNPSMETDHKKAFRRFLKILLVAAVFGGAVGFVSGFLADAGMGDSLAEQLNALLRLTAPWGIPVSGVLTLGVGAVLYRRASRQFASWDGEDEGTPEQAEQRLNWVLAATMLQTLLNFFFLAAGTRTKFALLIVAELLVSFGAATWLQQKTVDLIWKMNPEKRGSIYDVHFQKTWVDSCDEAERAQIGQASYRAYQATSTACIVLWVVTVIANLYFGTGLFPVVLVLVLWGILQGTYLLMVIRMGRKHVQ